MKATSCALCCLCTMILAHIPVACMRFFHSCPTCVCFTLACGRDTHGAAPGARRQTNCRKCRTEITGKITFPLRRRHQQAQGTQAQGRCRLKPLRCLPSMTGVREVKQERLLSPERRNTLTSVAASVGHLQTLTGTRPEASATDDLAHGNRARLASTSYPRLACLRTVVGRTGSRAICRRLVARHLLRLSVHSEGTPHLLGRPLR